MDAMITRLTTIANTRPTTDRLIPEVLPLTYGCLVAASLELAFLEMKYPCKCLVTPP
jgi:hypothetical protein